MKCIAIIPARGGSKGIRFKNIVKLANKPLIAYTIEAAEKSKIFDKIIVSTENKKIAKISKRCGAFVINRPRNLAKNITSTEAVMFDVLKQLKKKENYKPQIIVLLQPTSPLRDSLDIKKAYKKFLREEKDSLLSVSKIVRFVWRKHVNKFKPLNYNYLHRPRRQDINNQYTENGAIYITKYNAFIKNRNRLGGKIGYYVMSEKKSLEIDSSLDLLIAKHIVKRK